MGHMSSAPVHDGADRCADVVDLPEIRETHTGLVALVGDRAYKVKKPIATDFLDFRTVQHREEVCLREIELNSRLAAEAYLGIAHFTGPCSRDGVPEPVIVMRRYSDSSRLASMVRRGEPVDAHLSALAERIARFHADAVRGDDVDACGKASAIRARWRDNLTELRHYVGTLLTPESVAEVDRLAMRFIDGRDALFEDRIVSRRIVDGHGDLIAEDVFCLPDGPVALDCLEFDDRLRYLDGLDDAAFLTMDLEFLGAGALGDFFMNRYREVADDPAPKSLAHFYIAYRAVVRAKVDCIRVSQGVDGASADAVRHLELAARHLRIGTVRLVLVGGGPGTGKTTLARALAERLGARVISTDDVRREMWAAGQLDGVTGVYGSGLYSQSKVDAVYAEMLRRADQFLTSGQSVILDGTWRESRHRLAARELASKDHCPVVELACTVPLGKPGAASSTAAAGIRTPRRTSRRRWHWAMRVGRALIAWTPGDRWRQRLPRRTNSAV